MTITHNNDPIGPGKTVGTEAALPILGYSISKFRRFIQIGIIVAHGRDPENATRKLFYENCLIARKLVHDGFLSKGGKDQKTQSEIASILTNEFGEDDSRLLVSLQSQSAKDVAASVLTRH